MDRVLKNEYDFLRDKKEDWEGEVKTGLCTVLIDDLTGGEICTYQKSIEEGGYI